MFQFVHAVAAFHSIAAIVMLGLGAHGAFVALNGGRG